MELDGASTVILAIFPKEHLQITNRSPKPANSHPTPLLLVKPASLYPVLQHPATAWVSRDRVPSLLLHGVLLRDPCLGSSDQTSRTSDK